MGNKAATVHGLEENGDYFDTTAGYDTVSLSCMSWPRDGTHGAHAKFAARRRRLLTRTKSIQVHRLGIPEAIQVFDMTRSGPGKCGEYRGCLYLDRSFPVRCRCCMRPGRRHFG